MMTGCWLPGRLAACLSRVPGPPARAGRCAAPATATLEWSLPSSERVPAAPALLPCRASRCSQPAAAACLACLRTLVPSLRRWRLGTPVRPRHNDAPAALAPGTAGCVRPAAAACLACLRMATHASAALPRRTTRRPWYRRYRALQGNQRSNVWSHTATFEMKSDAQVGGGRGCSTRARPPACPHGVHAVRRAGRACGRRRPPARHAPAALCTLHPRTPPPHARAPARPLRCPQAQQAARAMALWSGKYVGGASSRLLTVQPNIIVDRLTGVKRLWLNTVYFGREAGAKARLAALVAPIVALGPSKSVFSKIKFANLASVGVAWGGRVGGWVGGWVAGSVLRGGVWRGRAGAAGGRPCAAPGHGCGGAATRGARPPARHPQQEPDDFGYDSAVNAGFDADKLWSVKRGEYAAAPLGVAGWRTLIDGVRGLPKYPPNYKANQPGTTITYFEAYEGEASCAACVLSRGRGWLVGWVAGAERAGRGGHHRHRLRGPRGCAGEWSAGRGSVEADWMAGGSVAWAGRAPPPTPSRWRGLVAGVSAACQASSLAGRPEAGRERARLPARRTAAALSTRTRSPPGSRAGAITDVPADATAFVHRARGFTVVTDHSFMPAPGVRDAALAWLAKLYDQQWKGVLSGGAYQVRGCACARVRKGCVTLRACCVGWVPAPLPPCTGTRPHRPLPARSLPRPPPPRPPSVQNYPSPTYTPAEALRKYYGANLCRLVRLKVSAGAGVRRAWGWGDWGARGYEQPAPPDAARGALQHASGSGRGLAWVARLLGCSPEPRRPSWAARSGCDARLATASLPPLPPPLLRAGPLRPQECLRRAAAGPAHQAGGLLSRRRRRLTRPGGPKARCRAAQKRAAATARGTAEVEWRCRRVSFSPTHPPTLVITPCATSPRDAAAPVTALHPTALPLVAPPLRACIHPGFRGLRA